MVVEGCGAGKPTLREAARGETQRCGTNTFGRITQHPSHPSSGALPGGHQASDGGGGDSGQHGFLISLGIDLGVVQYTAALEQRDEAIGGLLDQVLHLVIGGRIHGHEGGLIAIRVRHIHPVQHEHMGVNVEIELGMVDVDEGSGGPVVSHYYTLPAHRDFDSLLGSAFDASFFADGELIPCDLPGCSGATAVEAGSWGRIKASFR